MAWRRARCSSGCGRRCSGQNVRARNTEFSRVGKDYVLTARTRLSRPIADVFRFFAAAENLARITPPELGFIIKTPTPITMAAGANIDYTIKLWGIPVGWRTEITHWNPPYEFEDIQTKGPYAKWVHRHRFTEDGPSTLMEDEVRYRLPLGVLGRVAHFVVQRQLRRIFEYREATIRTLIESGQFDGPDSVTGEARRG